MYECVALVLTGKVFAKSQFVSPLSYGYSFNDLT